MLQPSGEPGWGGQAPTVVSLLPPPPRPAPCFTVSRSPDDAVARLSNTCSDAAKLVRERLCRHLLAARACSSDLAAGCVTPAPLPPMYCGLRKK